jgi:lysophospholipase L1-like esterase
LSTDNEPKKNLRILFIGCALASLLVAGLIAAFYLAKTNTLEKNGEWIPTKTTLTAYHLMGSGEYLRGTQALARNRLNLGAWHGLQEVLYRHPVRPTEISFRFLLKEEAYVVALFNHDKEGFEGVRFSANERFPTAYLRGKDTGEFTEKNPLNIPTIAPNQWVQATLKFDDKGFQLEVNGTASGHINAPARGLRKIGFRGSYKEAFIDDISITSDAAATVQESFSYFPRAGKVFFYALGAVVGLHLIILCLAVLAFLKKRTVLTGLLIADITLILFLAVAVPGQYFIFAAQYPSSYSTRIQEAENAFLTHEGDRIRQNIRDKYPSETMPDVVRILMLGSSQTWGAGVSTPEKTFTHLIEQRLNSELTPKTGRTYQCINAGIRGYRSYQLFDFYTEDWLNLNPALTVINLSNNDRDATRFEQSLNQYIALNHEHAIQTLLVPETNSIERQRPALFEHHEVMQKLATEQNIPLFPAYDYMSQPYDQGFLYWDSVHLTPYGNQLLAKGLGDAIIETLAGGQ